MKNMKWLFGLVALMAGSVGAAVTWRPLPVESMALYGATHVLTVGLADLTVVTNAAGAITLDVDLPASRTVELVRAVVTPAWTSSNTNETGVTVAVGDGSTATFYLASTTILGDTAVSLAVGSAVLPSVAVTLTPATTNVVNIAGTTNAVWTTATAAAVTSARGIKVTAASAKMRFTFTPAVGATSELLTGGLKLYIKMLEL